MNPVNPCEEIVPQKKCARCKAEKPLEAFHKNPTKRFGVSSYCIDCTKILKSEHRLDTDLIYHKDESTRPGHILKLILKKNKKTPAWLYREMKVPESTAYNLLEGKGNITPRLALKLESIGISTAKQWMYLQAKYDLWKYKQEEEI